MKHKWSPKGLYKGYNICDKCGLIKFIFYKPPFMTTHYYAGNNVILTKRPECTGEWPEKWQPCENNVKGFTDFYGKSPTISYTIYVDYPYATNKSMNVFCNDYEETKTHIAKYGMAIAIKTSFMPDTLDFLKWLLLENQLPKGFRVMICNQNHHSEDEIKLALSLAKNINGYVEILYEKNLEKL